MNTIKQAVVDGASTSVVAAVAEKAGVLVPVDFQNNLPFGDPFVPGYQFYGVSGAVGSVVGDMVRDYLKGMGVGTGLSDTLEVVAGPAAAAAAAYAFLAVSSPGALSGGLVSPAQILATVAVGKLVGERVEDML